MAKLNPVRTSLTFRPAIKRQELLKKVQVGLWYPEAGYVLGQEDPSMPNSSGAEEAVIRELLEAKVVATRAKDVRAVMSVFASDVVCFDVVDPLRHSGADAVRGRAETWFSTVRGPIGFELHDVHVSVADDVAFAYGLNHAVGHLMAGGRLDMWWRETICLEKRHGRWWITHAHDSVPFNPETSKPSVSLRP
jgi:ketosteroid isomerase-like protein